MFIVGILLIVTLLLLYIATNKLARRYLYELSLLEVIWTILPGVVLVSLGIPRLIILYNREKNFLCNLNIKVTGHQWFWRYDYSDFTNVEFDSYIKAFGDLKVGELRLLETDNNIVLPFKSNCQFLVSSSDVLHRWTVPSLGVKVDANPGRINLVSTDLPVCGLYYGQCSEICGANHSFMPICLEVTTFTLFKNWLKSF